MPHYRSISDLIAQWVSANINPTSAAPHTASNSTASLSYTGPTLYSYSQPIAQFRRDGGQTVCAVTATRWSQTTSRHTAAAQRAAGRYVPVIQSETLAAE